MASPEKVNLAQTLSLFGEHWNPKIVGELNGQHVKLVKILGEFVWHHHDEEDDCFSWWRDDSGCSSGIDPSGSTRASS